MTTKVIIFNDGERPIKITHSATQFPVYDPEILGVDESTWYNIWDETSIKIEEVNEDSSV